MAGKPKILIVEDERLVARMYQKTLTNEGFEVKIAIGGQEGAARIKNDQPDLVLLDIMMPEFNGIEVLEKIKVDPATKAIPVVVLTNLAGSHDTQLALSKGAKAYWVKKETEPKALGRKIKEILVKKGKKVEEPKAEEKTEEKKKEDKK